MTQGKAWSTGERAWNTLRLVNAREGFNREHDQVPRQFLEPLKSGDQDFYMTVYSGQQLTPEAVVSLFVGYYRERGWDLTIGPPLPEKLAQLGLEAMG